MPFLIQWSKWDSKGVLLLRIVLSLARQPLWTGLGGLRPSEQGPSKWAHLSVKEIWSDAKITSENAVFHLGTFWGCCICHEDRAGVPWASALVWTSQSGAWSGVLRKNFFPTLSFSMCICAHEHSCTYVQPLLSLKKIQMAPPTHCRFTAPFRLLCQALVHIWYLNALPIWTVFTIPFSTAPTCTSP